MQQNLSIIVGQHVDVYFADSDEMEVVKRSAVLIEDGFLKVRDNSGFSESYDYFTWDELRDNEREAIAKEIFTLKEKRFELERKIEEWEQIAALRFPQHPRFNETVFKQRFPHLSPNMRLLDHSWEELEQMELQAAWEDRQNLD